MFLSDFHTHSTFSSDAKNTMVEMAQAAYDRGLDCICFTDHADDCMKESDLSFTPDKYVNKSGIYVEYLQTRDMMKDKLDIRFGMELSAANQNPKMAEKLTHLYPFDFIIGSVHNLTGRDDFYFLSYKEEKDCYDLIDQYLDEHMLMINTGGFNVIGHIGYLLKYMAGYGIMLNLSPYMDKVRTILKLAIEKGIGIEVNTSGLRCALGVTIPDFSVLKLYRELGGEIITTGSDSHNTMDIGKGIQTAGEMLKAAGFEYVTVFKQGKPEFVKL